MALVAEHGSARRRLRSSASAGSSKLHGGDEAEFALLVSDGFQRQGLGTELLRRLIEVGRDEGLRRIVGDISPENRRMITSRPRPASAPGPRPTTPQW